MRHGLHVRLCPPDYPVMRKGGSKEGRKGPTSKLMKLFPVPRWPGHSGVALGFAKSQNKLPRSLCSESPVLLWSGVFVPHTLQPHLSAAPSVLVPVRTHTAIEDW